MTNTPAESPQRPTPSILSPVIDILCVGGLSLIVFIPLLLTGRSDLVLIGAGAQAWLATVINMPHFMASYRIVYRSRAMIAAHRWAAIYVPAILLLYILIALWEAQSSTVLVIILISVASAYLAWHYTGQVWGMMASFAYLEGTAFEKSERFLIRTSLRILLAWHVTWFLYTQLRDPAAVRPLYLLVSAGTLVAFGLGATGLVRMRRRTGLLPPARALVAWAAIFVWYAVMARDPKAIFWIQIAHALQYLAFPIRVEINRTAATATRAGARLATHMALYGAALLGLSYVVARIVPGSAMSAVADIFGEEPGRVAPILILMFINIHHYFTDGVIWKLSNPEVRRELFAHVVRARRAGLLVATTVTAALAAGCTRAPDPDPRMVAEWMRTLYGAVRVERLSPPVASRILGYATTALHAGITVADPRAPSLSGVLNGLGDLPRAQPGQDYDPTLTAVAAERVVLDSLLAEALPTTHAAFAGLADSLTAARMMAGTAEETRHRSDELGKRIGLAIIAWSRTDGFDSTRGRTYVAPVGAGLWFNDAPGSIYATRNMSGATNFVALDNPANTLDRGGANDRGLILDRPKQKGLAALPAVNMAGMSEPYWAQVRPFVLQSWSECPIPDPPAYSIDTASLLYADARTVHRTSTVITPEERTIALYWADNAGETGTPVGHWISIASQMVSQRNLSAQDAARLMVLTAAAQADAFIAAWGFKYRYNLLRPRTYIRSVIDSTWEPFIPTPPFPEYPSAHSAQSAAAAAVLTALFGNVPFDDSTSISIGHRVRRFESFTAAANEAGMSRVYGGIHFPVGNTAGRALGQCVGALVAARLGASPK